MVNVATPKLVVNISSSGVAYTRLLVFIVTAEYNGTTEKTPELSRTAPERVGKVTCVALQLSFPTEIPSELPAVMVMVSAFASGENARTAVKARSATENFFILRLLKFTGWFKFRLTGVSIGNRG
jgi:hypothetical protein